MARNPWLDGFAGTIPLIGGGKTKFQPVFVGDVAEAVCAALERDEARGRVYELGGPRTYTFKELMQFVVRETERRTPLLPLPFVFAYPIGLMAGWVLGLFGDPPLTGDQVVLLRRDNVAGGDPAAGSLADLGVTQLETIEAIVPSYIWRFRPYGQFQTRQNPA
jgi:NADH dehydrogenase